MLVIAALLLASMWWLPLALLVGMGVHVWRALVASAAEQRAQAWQEGLEVAARADEQQRLVLAGDPRGVYGNYTPAV
jgi:hypothetical protein